MAFKLLCCHHHQVRARKQNLVLTFPIKCLDRSRYCGTIVSIREKGWQIKNYKGQLDVVNVWVRQLRLSPNTSNPYCFEFAVKSCMEIARPFWTARSKPPDYFAQPVQLNCISWNDHVVSVWVTSALNRRGWGWGGQKQGVRWWGEHKQGWSVKARQAKHLNQAKLARHSAWCRLRVLLIQRNYPPVWQRSGCAPSFTLVGSGMCTFQAFAQPKHAMATGISFARVRVWGRGDRKHRCMVMSECAYHVRRVGREMFWKKAGACMKATFAPACQNLGKRCEVCIQINEQMWPINFVFWAWDKLLWS